MRSNPFDLPPKPTPRPLVDVARIVSGPAAAELMRRLESRGGKKVSTRKHIKNFSLTTDEQLAIQEAQRFEPLLRSEHQRLLAFFGESFVIPPLPKEITPELKEFWEKNGFKLEYWPRVHMSEEKNFPGWEHKPGKPYAEYSDDFFGSIDRMQEIPNNKRNPSLAGLSPLDLPGAWVLRDARPKPNFVAGGPTYENDSLFEETMGSRSGRMPDEFQYPDFWTPLARALKIDAVPGARIRLPRMIETSVMGQGPEFHETNHVEWCEEYYSSTQRVFSGDCNAGGVSQFQNESMGDSSIGCRPLVVFPTS